MTYKEAVKKREEYKHLIGTKMDKSATDSRFNLITHLVVAPYNSTTADVTNLVSAYNADNETVLKLTGATINSDFKVFVVCYSSWDNFVGFWLLDRYLSQ